MPSLHSIRAALVAAAIAVPLAAGAQQAPVVPQLQEAGATNFSIFLRGAPIGTEQVAITRTATGWTIVSTGRLAAPIDIVGRRVQARYTADWKPLEFTYDAVIRGQATTVRTVVEGTSARSDVQTTTHTEKTDTIDPNSILLLGNSFFGPYEALAARLKTLEPGAEVPVYLVPQTSIKIAIGETTPERIQTPGRLVTARRTRISLILPSGRLDADLWVDDAGRMIRFSVPVQSLEVVREDIAAVSSRSVTISRPNDEQISIPSNGFSLAGTLSKPAQSPAGARLPAVVLVGGSGPTDRDSLVVGIPIFGQIADALANAGYIVVRYDKRGIGQSGGRAEAASLADYADDARAVVKLLSDRKDVDPKRIAMVGHSEGGLVALMAAAKDKKIAAVTLIATPGMSGADIVLAQQKRLLDASKMTAEEKQAKVEQQKKIQEAVMTGKGLEQLPPDVRRSVDNPEFQGILLSDPAKLVAAVRQPLLIVQGMLDMQVEAQNADLLERLAKQRKNAGGVEVVKVPGINHLLVPATTGEFSEYADLKDKHVSSAVTDAIVTWLNKTLSTAR
jgi:pimeloyl-ACP methyl ester carboxylesterase